MPNKKIKKCPLCGSYMKLRKRQRTMMNNRPYRITYCYCKTCDMRGPRVRYVDYDNAEMAEVEAIRLMNRRFYESNNKENES